MLVQMNKCVACGSDCKEGTVVFGVCTELGQGTTGRPGECCTGATHGECHGACDSVATSPVEVRVDHDGAKVFHVCPDSRCPDSHCVLLLILHPWLYAHT